MPYTHNQANGEGNRAIEFAGSYNVRIMDSSEAKYSQAGNPSMNINYQVLDGTQAGRVISFDSFTDSENANWKIDRILNAVNFPDGQSFQGDGLSGVVAALIGKVLRITTNWQQQSQGKNAGKWYPSVTDYEVAKKEVSSETFNDQPRPQETNVKATQGFGTTTSAPKANDAAFAKYNQQKNHPQAQGTAGTQQGFTTGQMYGSNPNVTQNPFNNGQEVNISDDDLPF